MLNEYDEGALHCMFVLGLFWGGVVYAVLGEIYRQLKERRTKTIKSPEEDDAD